jgi:HAD superfamily hydrolase (TIGR01490 family)
MAQRIAFFDLDGTLFRWQLFHEIVFELKDSKQFDDETADELDEALIKWQGKEFDWTTYENLLINGLKKHLPGMSVEIFEAAARKVVDRSGHKIYNYTRHLADSLKDDGYFLLAVTGSYQEIAEPFALRYGFDDCIGAVLARENGIFTTGNSSRVVYGQKAERIREFMETGDYTLKGSVAVGDSGGDLGMLELVERPIAFNPSEDLLEIALKNDWEIVIERKNIAYQLQKDSDGHVVLAKTDRY